MDNRMIPCPNKCVDGKLHHTECYGGPPVEVAIDCDVCNGEGSIPNRRALSANDRLLLNLLAVIHRDGGQHTGKVGIEQSVAHAMTLVRSPTANDRWLTQSERSEERTESNPEG